MTNTNRVNTCWDGWVTLSDRITQKAKTGFRTGGCAALAWKVYNMVPGAELVVYCDPREIPEESETDPLEWERALYDSWGHAGVTIPGYDGVLDIGGFDDYDSETWCEPYFWPDPHTFVDLIVNDCPPQDAYTVDFFAHKMLRKYVPNWKTLLDSSELVRI